VGNSAFHRGKCGEEEKDDCIVEVVHYCSKGLEFCLHHCQRVYVTFNNTKAFISFAVLIYWLLILEELITASEINAF